MKNKIIVSGIILIVVVMIILSTINIFNKNFTTMSDGLPLVKETEIVNLKDGDTYNMTMSPVKKTINGKEIRMLAYNGMIPGPTIRVKQGSKVTINLKNNADVDTALHSHGVRLDSKYDGVIGLDQDAIKPGQSFTYKIKFPDAGVFWYHPHYREDYAQDMGLYGNYIVESNNYNYLSGVNKEEVITLDDILMDENGIVPFQKNNVDHALMGRYGNIMLTNGKTDYSLDANIGDVVRFYFTNVANTRPFKIAIPNAKMKLVAGDQSKYERETFVDNILLGPSERTVVDVYFPKAGVYKLMHNGPTDTYDLGTINIGTKYSQTSFTSSFYVTHTNTDVINDINNYRKYFNKAPDKKLKLSINMGGDDGQSMGMHQMPDGSMMSNDGMTMHGVQGDGIEWEDSMNKMNKMMDATTEWQIIEESTGKKNMDIFWDFKKGDVVKVEIDNTKNSMHPMQHPIHFHGQRFLVLSRNGVKDNNLVWKDTVLIPAGQKVEILIDMSNAGDWMAHCHIAEHLEAGMMFDFKVE